MLNVWHFFNYSRYGRTAATEIASARRGMLPSFFFEAYRLRKVPLIESLRIIGRGSLNWIAERPIVVSFEVTDACTCYCKHCDHGGPRDDRAI